MSGQSEIAGNEKADSSAGLGANKRFLGRESKLSIVKSTKEVIVSTRSALSIKKME